MNCLQNTCKDSTVTIKFTQSYNVSLLLLGMTDRFLCVFCVSWYFSAPMLWERPCESSTTALVPAVATAPWEVAQQMGGEFLSPPSCSSGRSANSSGTNSSVTQSNFFQCSLFRRSLVHKRNGGLINFNELDPRREVRGKKQLFSIDQSVNELINWFKELNHTQRILERAAQTRGFKN